MVHALGGWLALPAVLLPDARSNRYRKDGAISAHPPSNIPFLALGAWILTLGWFGFNVMSAQTIDKISGLVAVKSLIAMAGGTLAAAQVIGTALGVGWALLAGFVVYGLIKSVTGLRLSQEAEYDGADISIHCIGSAPDREVNW